MAFLSHENELNLSYFAGLFDGEGSVGIIRTTSRTNIKRDGTPVVRYIPKIQMGMIDEKPIREFAKFFGLSVYKYEKQRTKSGKIITVYKIVCGCRKIKPVLLNLLPYFRCQQKIEGAHICLELLRVNGLRQKGRITTDSLIQRQELYLRSRKNNGYRGKQGHTAQNIGG